MANTNCALACPSAAHTLFQIERAYLLLNAAHAEHDLSGKIYRNTLAVAMRALGEAAAALQVQKSRACPGEVSA